MKLLLEVDAEVKLPKVLLFLLQIRQFSSILPQGSLKKRLLMDLTSYNGLNRVDSVRCKITMLRIVSNLSVVRLQCSELSRFGPL